MARKPTTQPLDTGDIFPPLQLTLTDGRLLRLPSDLRPAFNVIIVNRGAWCPFCTAQLKGFQAGLGKLTEAGIGVVSFSTDTLDAASNMVAQDKLEFPVGYGASLRGVAETLGVYYDPEPKHTAPYLQSAGFILGPGAQVLNAVYSSGALGRLVWQDVLSFVNYLKSHT